MLHGVDQHISDYSVNAYDISNLPYHIYME